MPHAHSFLARRPFMLSLLVATALTACGGSDDDTPAPAAQNATAQLALLSTTDLHYYARSYN